MGRNGLTLETCGEQLSTRTTPPAPASQRPKLHFPKREAGAITARQLSGAKFRAGAESPQARRSQGPSGAGSAAPAAGGGERPREPGCVGRCAPGALGVWSPGSSLFPSSLLPPPSPGRGHSPHSSKVVSRLLPSLKLTKPDFYSQHRQLPVNLH